MTTSVIISWPRPETTARQRPVSFVRIEARVAADLPWTEVANVGVSALPTQSVTLTDVPDGTWFYRGFVIDKAGRESLPLEAEPFEVGFDDPSPLVSLTVGQLA